MGYIDGFIDPHFKPKDSETLIFFPGGIGSRGRIISKADEIRIRKFLRIFYITSLWISLVAVASVGIYALGVLVVLIPWYMAEMRHLLRGKEKTNERFSIHHTFTISAISSGLPTCLLLVFGAVALLGASLWVFLKTKDKFIGIVGSLFFGLALLVLLPQLIIVLRSRQRP